MSNNEPTRYGGHTLDELEAMEQQATPAPWYQNDTEPQPYVVYCGSTTNPDKALLIATEWTDQVFVSAARNALPDLLERIRYLEAQHQLDRQTIESFVVDGDMLTDAVQTLGDTGDFEVFYEGGAWTVQCEAREAREASGDTPAMAIVKLAARIKEANDGL